MLRIAIFAIVIVGGAFLATQLPYKETFQNPAEVITKTEVVKEVKDELSARVETAQTEAEQDITAKAQAAYDASLQASLKEIELRVTSEYRKELEAKETALEKELSF